MNTKINNIWEEVECYYCGEHFSIDANLKDVFGNDVIATDCNGESLFEDRYGNIKYHCPSCQDW